MHWQQIEAVAIIKTKIFSVVITIINPPGEGGAVVKSGHPDHDQEFVRRDQSCCSVVTRCWLLRLRDALVHKALL